MKKYYKLNRQNFKNNKNILSNVSLDIEFDKWLNYESNYEKERKNYLLSLDIEKLNNEEINELKTYNEDLLYKDLINKYTYNVDECSEEEYNKSIEYICSNSIDNLIERKISKNDKDLADKKIKELFLHIDKKELSNFINKFNNENFKDICIMDAYIYHQAVKLLNDLELQEQNNIIKTKKSFNLFKRLIFKPTI